MKFFGRFGRGGLIGIGTFLVLAVGSLLYYKIVHDTEAQNYDNVEQLAKRVNKSGVHSIIDEEEEKDDD